MTKRYLYVTDGSGPIQFPGGYPANDGEVAVLDDEDPRLQEFFDYGATKKSFHEALDTQAQRLDRSALRLARPGQAVRQQGQRLALIAHRLTAHLPRATQGQRTRLMQLDGALRRAVDLRLAAHGQRLDSLAARLRVLDPHQVLARGYAWLSDASGRPVGSVQQLATGATLQAVLHDGSADVVVAKVQGRTSG